MTGGNSSNRPYEVVVVDDSNDDGQLLLRALQKVQLDIDMEIDAHPFSSSADASARLKERKCDAIFPDINMPPPDGMELSKQIYSLEINRDTPIVILTGADDGGLVTWAFQAGANLFLSKPIDRVRLLRLVQVLSVPIDRERRRLQRVKAQ